MVNNNGGALYGLMGLNLEDTLLNSVRKVEHNVCVEKQTKLSQTHAATG